VNHLCRACLCGYIGLFCGGKELPIYVMHSCGYIGLFCGEKDLSLRVGHLCGYVGRSGANRIDE